MAEAPKLLDADTLIDEILAKKGPHVYQDGLSEENWEEELEQIPLFMTKSPDAGDVEKSPALSALQTLKYELSSPESRAAAHKDEGNEQFRLKHYRQAIEEYTAGLREGMNKEGRATEEVGVVLRAILYTNRAAAHFYLGNLRSCLNDVKEARKIKPDHLKAVHRGVMVCIKLGQYGEAVEWCDHGLRVDPEHSKLKDLRTQAVREKKRHDRDQRKQVMQEQAKAKAEEVERSKLLEAIRSRGIQLASSLSLDGDNVETPHLVLDGAHPTGDKVHFDPQDRLVWPVLFLYPEHGQTDFISAFHEDQRFSDHLEVMFEGENRPSWDPHGMYTPTTLKVYFENSFGGGFVAVEPTMTLQEALSSQGYTVGAGTPSFFILSANSPFTQHFLQQT